LVAHALEPWHTGRRLRPRERCARNPHSFGARLRLRSACGLRFRPWARRPVRQDGLTATDRHRRADHPANRRALSTARKSWCGDGLRPPRFAL